MIPTGASTYTYSSGTDVVSPIADPTYSVSGTDANGCMNTTTITQDVSLCTGIATMSSNKITINLYPNPNNGIFTIELNTLSQVSMTDALGQIIITETMETGKHNLDIHNQPTDIYFVKVTQYGKQHVIKLIKN